MHESPRTSILNRTQLRDYTLWCVRHYRPALATKKTRVSEDFFLAMESRLRVKVFSDIDAQDGGALKTLRPPDGFEGRDAGAPWLLCQSAFHDLVHRAFSGRSLSQVSPGYVEWADAWLRKAVAMHVQNMPSIGKTIG